MLSLEFPGLLPTLQADVMQRWVRTSYRRKWHRLIAEAVLSQGRRPPKPLKAAQITGIRYCAGRQPDRINVWYSFKPLVDALIVCGVLVDDGPEILVAEQYYSVRVKTRAEQRTTIGVVGVD